MFNLTCLKMILQLTSSFTGNFRLLPMIYFHATLCTAKFYFQDIEQLTKQFQLLDLNIEPMDTDEYSIKELQAGSKSIHERNLEHIKKPEQQCERVKSLRIYIQPKGLSQNNQLHQKTQAKEQWLHVSVQEVKQVNITFKF